MIPPSDVIGAYAPGDIAAIRPRGDFVELARELPFDGGEPDLATTFSLRRAGLVVACGGFIRERMGVYSLWGLCDETLTRREWIEIAHMAKALIVMLFQTGAHRIHSMARADTEKAVAFLHHLGLKNDANRLIAFGPDGEDYVLLAAIKELRG